MKKIITRSLVCASLMAGMSQVVAANDVVAREDSFSKGHPPGFLRLVVQDEKGKQGFGRRMTDVCHKPHFMLS